MYWKSKIWFLIACVCHNYDLQDVEIRLKMQVRSTAQCNSLLVIRDMNVTVTIPDLAALIIVGFSLFLA